MGDAWIFATPDLTPLVDTLTDVWSKRFPDMSVDRIRDAVEKLVHQIKDAGYDIVPMAERRIM